MIPVAGVEVDLRELDAAFKILGQHDLREPLRMMRGLMRQDMGAHMAKQEGPTGASWAPLAASTVKARLAGMRRGHVTTLTSYKRKKSQATHTKRGALRKVAQRRIDRVLSKRLLSRASVKVDATSITFDAFGRAVDVHQGGGRAGHGASIPARPYVWISTQLAQTVADFLLLWLIAKADMASGSDAAKARAGTWLQIVGNSR